MTNEVRTRVLTEAGEWKEADKPEERLPKTRRFVLVEAPAQSPVAGTGVIAEGVCWTDGSVALHFRSEQRATVHYHSVEDVIAGNGGELNWVD